MTKKRERAALLALLNCNELAVDWIWQAIERYRQDLPAEIEREQTPTAISKDAKHLHQALQTIAEQIAKGGDAWLTFKQNCATEGSRAIAALHCLTEALGPGANEPADWLLSAAEITEKELKPSIKRPKSAAVAVRYNLLHHVIEASKRAGIEVSRNNPAFLNIVALAYQAANIYTDPDHDIRRLKPLI